MSDLLSAFSNIIGASMAQRDSSMNRKAQYDFAQRGIQWKVADAKKAGIHPLYALGATGAMYSPVHSDAPAFAAAAGQDLSRAIHTAMTARERRTLEHAAIVRQQMEDDIALQRHGKDMERADLENALLRSQVARLNSGQSGPPMADAKPGSVDVIPDSVVVGSPGAPERSPGEITDYSFGHVAPGNNGLERYSLVQSQDFHNRTEDTPQEWSWMLRNGIVPSDNIFRDLHARHPPRSGYEWRYDPFGGYFWQSPIQRGRRHY